MGPWQVLIFWVSWSGSNGNEGYISLPRSPELYPLHQMQFSSVSWGCKNTPTASLQKGKTPPHNECPRYDTKQSHIEVRVMLELWGMWSTPSLPSLPGPLWPGVVAPDRILSMGQIELNCVLMLNWIIWNRNVLTFKLGTYAKLNCSK